MTEVGNPVPENVIPHLSLLGWEHITFTRSCDWRQHASDINVLRPLRTFKLLDKKRKTAQESYPAIRIMGPGDPLKRTRRSR
jgi:hypothetical protein